MIEILDGPGKAVSWPPIQKGWTIPELNSIPDVVVVKHADLLAVDTLAKSVSRGAEQLRTLNQRGLLTNELLDLFLDRMVHVFREDR